jgi:hypothetical protein
MTYFVKFCEHQTVPNMIYTDKIEHDPRVAVRIFFFTEMSKGY